MIKRKYLGEVHELSLRDSQMSKVYKGENAAWGPDIRAKLDDPSVEGCQAYVDSVVSSASWKRIRAKFDPVWGYKLGRVEVHDGRGCRRAWGGPGGVTLPVWARTKPVILHELAHVMVGTGVGHSWMFCRAYIELSASFIGREEADRLEAHLKVAGCRTMPKRRMSEAAKVALAARGRAALAAYAKRKGGAQ